MSATENAFDVFHPSIEFEHEALMITRPNDFNEPVSAHNSLSFISQSTTLFLKLTTLYMILKSPWLMKWKFKKPLVMLPSLLYMIQKLRKKKQKFCIRFVKVAEEEIQFLNWSCIFNFKSNASYTETIIETWFTERWFTKISVIKLKISIQISIEIVLLGFITE